MLKHLENLNKNHFQDLSFIMIIKQSYFFWLSSMMHPSVNLMGALKKQRVCNFEDYRKPIIRSFMERHLINILLQCFLHHVYNYKINNRFYMSSNSKDSCILKKWSLLIQILEPFQFCHVWWFLLILKCSLVFFYLIRLCGCLHFIKENIF